MSTGPYRWRYLPPPVGTQAASGTSGTATLASGPAVGDACIVRLNLTADSAVTAPSDFTLVGEPASGLHMYVSKRISTTSLSWTFTSTSWKTIVHWFTPSVPLAASEIGMTVGSFGSSSTSPVAPSITPGGNNATVIYAAINAVNNGITAPAGYVHKSDANNGTTPVLGGGEAQTYQSVAAATGDVTGTSDGSAMWAVLIALYPTGVNLLPAMTATSGTMFGGPGVRWDRTAGAWTAPGPAGTSLSVDDVITTAIANGDDGIGLPTGANTVQSLVMGISDAPANFVTMSALAMRFSTDWVGTISNDVIRIECIIRRSGGGTILAGRSSTLEENVSFHNGTTWIGSGSHASDSPVYDNNFQFSYLDTSANQTVWNGAEITFTFTHTTSMGSDNTALILVDFELVGTYTKSPASGARRPTHRQLTYR